MISRMTEIAQRANRGLLWRLGVTAVFLVLLSGCMYRGEVQKGYSLASGEYLTVVQNAVDTYRKATGVLPIKTKPQETPLYEKYLIDFKKIKDRNMISTVPTNAFENGGTALYVIVDAETKPTVKLMDLTAYQKVVQLQADVDAYKAKKDVLPLGSQVAPSMYSLDFDKLGQKMEQFRSPYSNQFLTVILSESGQVAIDYGPEIMKLINKKSIKPDPSQDLRSLLVEEGFYVPVRSFPYYWSDNQPVVKQE
ncbi:hypothetical protein [Paenibacillus sp. MBLB4367]|uniref:hypothetical protein n=1 Tax=Paenibacillus sp. MBLB4367 TaxID=3384767 RepID=UPI003908393D